MAITEGNPPAQPFRGNLYRASAESAAWLSHCTEAVREPELRLVDAHHHLWSDERGRYELAEMGRDVRGSNVVGTVYVECGSGYEASVDYGAFGQTDVAPYLRAVAETEYVVHAVRDAGAAGFGACRGIVGFANLLLGPGVRAVLEAQIEAGDGRFRGIRQSAGWDAALGEMAYRNPPPGLLVDERFQAGFAMLEPLGLSYDTWILFPQMPDVMALADRFPTTTIILDHFGGLIGIGPYASRRAEVFRLWQTYLRRLAERPNVILKMGGLGMVVTGSQFHLRDTPPGSADLAEAWRPYVETAVEAFGPERCMIGSNFPVDRQSSTYTVLWNAYKRCTSQYSSADRDAIHADTALRVYRLG